MRASCIEEISGKMITRVRSHENVCRQHSCTWALKKKKSAIMQPKNLPFLCLKWLVKQWILSFFFFNEQSEF